MNWQFLLADVFDLRAFDSLWYWLLMGLSWAVVTQRALGVPWDLVQRGRQSGDAGAAELDALVHLFAHRTLDITDMGALVMMAVGCFVGSVLAIVGFVYGSELALALLIWGGGLALTVPLNIFTAREIVTKDLSGADLWLILSRHRLALHVIAAAAVFLAGVFSVVQSPGFAGPFGGLITP